MLYVVIFQIHTLRECVRINDILAEFHLLFSSVLHNRHSIRKRFGLEFQMEDRESLKYLYQLESVASSLQEQFQDQD